MKKTSKITESIKPTEVRKILEAIRTTGKRKTAIARVGLLEGKGNIKVNTKKLEEYFPVYTLQETVKQPLKLTSLLEGHDVWVKVHGGGKRGQAEAIRLAIAKAIYESNKELKPILKKHKLLTRDPRIVERKKYGQKKARKKFQFSKR